MTTVKITWMDTVHTMEILSSGQGGWIAHLILFMALSQGTERKKRKKKRREGSSYIGLSDPLPCPSHASHRVACDPLWLKGRPISVSLTLSPVLLTPHTV
ncbi:hypothetical protein ACOMHN_058449 [Nucella lapillus]